MKDEFANTLNEDTLLLNETLLENQNVEENVTFFSNFITFRANHYFEKHIKVRKGFKFECYSSKEMQAWYDQECREKKSKLFVKL